MSSRLALLALAISTVAFADGPVTDEKVAEISKRFAESIKCDAKAKDLQRAWCAVTKVKDAAFKAPAKISTLLGLSVELPDSSAINEQLLGTTTVSALYLGPTTAKLTWLKPSNDKEKEEMLPVLFEIAGALKMGTKSISVPKGLNDFLSGEQARPGYPITANGKGMDYAAKLPSRLYQVGNVYVVFESAPSGYLVSVFPAVPLKVK